MTDKQTSAGRGLYAFGRWWLDRMTELLPRTLRGENRQDLRVMLHADGTIDAQDLQLCRQALFAVDGGRVRWYRSLWWRAPDISLVLPPGSILSRDVPLPAAAAGNAMQAIGYSLDRLTPFQADEAVWSVSRKSEAGRNAMAIFQLHVAPRFLFGSALELMQREGIAPTRLCMDGPPGEAGVIPFHEPKQKQHPVLRALPVLAVIAAIVPFVVQQVHLFRLNHAISALSDRRGQAESLRRRIDSFTAGPAEIAKEERRTGSALKTLAVLTDALPDGTFLTTLRIREHHVTLEGQSRQATQLIGILEHSAAFTDASFSGPVTRTEDKSQDVFTINANAPD